MEPFAKLNGNDDGAVAQDKLKTPCRRTATTASWSVWTSTFATWAATAMAASTAMN